MELVSKRMHRIVPPTGWRCLFLVLVLVLGLAGCVLQIPNKPLPVVVHVSEHDGAGRVVRSATMDERADLHQRLRSFLAKERTGWCWTLASYVPGPYVFSAEGIEVHCSESVVTVNFLEGGEWRSYSKSVDGALANFDLPSAFPKSEARP
jgi:hypothetical protein